MRAVETARASIAIFCAGLIISLLFGVAAAQQPTAPRTPMGPGSLAFDRGLVGIAPSFREMTPQDAVTTEVPAYAPAYGGHQYGVPASAMFPDTDALPILASGKADVVVLSRAATSLSLFLFRPDQNQWQEYALAPLAMTNINCPTCNGRLKFAFNDGVEQQQFDVEAPSILRIYPDGSASRWKWDSFKVQSAAKPVD